MELTPDERKRGLRAAVEAKLTSHGLSGGYHYEIDLLWGIIDSLVEECAVEPQAFWHCPHCGSPNVCEHVRPADKEVNG